MTAASWCVLFFCLGLARAALLPRESELVSKINPENIRENLRHYTSVSHIAGTPADYDLAVWTAAQLEASGWETELNEYRVLLTFPNTTHPSSLRVVAPEDQLFEASLHEPPVSEDSTSNLPHAPLFLGYSPTGTCTSELVYASYGRNKDYDKLTELGVDFAGKVGIVRYGKGFRGDKAFIAQDHGLCGLIIYNDPAEFMQGPAYPDGEWLPPAGSQRGTLFLDEGDPLTPGYASVEGTPRLSRTDPRIMIPKIPVLPVSAAAALGLMKGMGGPNATALELGPDWVGGLNLTYSLGPGPTTVEITVHSNFTEAPIWNVIAKMSGAVEPDRAVVLGNHRDAWAFGAADPNSGSAAMLELARAFGELAAGGWRPRRTLMLCSWDAEEQGLLGSTEWVEDNIALVKAQAVAYLNVDIAVQGKPTFVAGGSPALGNLMRAAAADVAHPDGGSISEHWNGEVEGPGAGTDYVAFLDYAGVPVTDMWFERNGDYPTYHSIYDSFHWMETFIDPTFAYHRAIAQMWALMALRLSEASVLPIEYTALSSRMLDFVSDLEAEVSTKRPQLSPKLASLRTAIEGFQQSALWAHTRSQEVLSASAIKQRSFNDALMNTERSFLSEEGLPNRSWFKHLVFAPSQFDQYGSTGFPGITDAISAQKWDVAERQIWLAAYTVERSGRAMRSQL